MAGLQRGNTSMRDWRVAHEKAIHDFMEYLNQESGDFILKGGTALLLCYHLDRFSEDIDLDGKGGNIQDIVEGFCEKNGYSYRVAKDTDTVKRFMINYGNDQKPLKIEVSYRRKRIAPEETTKRNGILVYNIDELCAMKTNAYSGRDKMRDLYDLSFICKAYFEQLSDKTISFLRNAMEYKGVEQFDYIMREQKDDLIDENKLAEDFLLMFDKLGLLYDEEEKKIASKLIHTPNPHQEIE
jgi:predicted nucleotidyltransferase component of viral defense system